MKFRYLWLTFLIAGMPTASQSADVSATEPAVTTAYSDDSDPGNPFKVIAEISAWTQFYSGPPEYSGQVEGVIPVLDGSVRFEYSANDAADRFVFEPHGRYDIRAGTDLIDLKEAYYSHKGDNWEFLIGAHTLFWGTTETRHLVNVINQVDLAGDVVHENFLGQPMVNLNLVSDTLGTLELYGLFGFRPRDHPDTSDRLRISLPINDGAALYEGSEAEKHLAFAVRHANQIDLGALGLDYGVYYFHGMNREPRFDLDATIDTLTPVPAYDIMEQVGVDAVLAYENLQLKFEGIWRQTELNSFTAAVAGFEYTLPELAGMNIGLIGEYLYDGRSTDPFTNAPTAFQNDIAGGVRVDFNDVRGTNLLAGMTYDLDDSSKSVSVEFRTRLRDDLLLSIDGRAFLDLTPAAFGAIIPEDDSFIRTKVTMFY